MEGLTLINDLLLWSVPDGCHQKRIERQGHLRPPGSKLYVYFAPFFPDFTLSTSKVQADC
jgi:hypothetical protein